MTDTREVQDIVPRPMTPAQFKLLVGGEAQKSGAITARANIRLEK